MHFSWFLFLLAFSTTSTLATPVRDDPNSSDDATILSNSLDLDLSKDSTNQPPSEVASSKSSSQNHATNQDLKDMPFQDRSKLSVDLSQRSPSESSNTSPANLFSTNSPSVPSPGQQPTTSNSPDRVDVPFQPSLTPGNLATASDWPSFPPPSDRGPDCKGWWRLCCFGDIFFDDEGFMSIDQCYPCNDSSHFSSCFFSLPLVDFLGNSMTVGTSTN